MRKVFHHDVKVGFRQRIGERTVYGDCNTLGQFVTICAHKRWYSSEFIDLQIFKTERLLGSIGVNNLEVKLVGLGDGSNSCGACVSLLESMLTSYALARMLQQEMKTYLTGVELPKGHA